MRLRYIENVRLPTEKAHGYQIMKTAAAFVAAGIDTELVVAARKNSLGDQDPFDYFGITTVFSLLRLPVIDWMPFAGPFMRAAYVLERWSFLWQVRTLTRRSQDADVYYTRDLAVAEALLDVPNHGPIFVELHDDRSNDARWKRVCAGVRGWIVISHALGKLLVEKGVDPRCIFVEPDACDEADFTLPLSKSAARALLGIPEEAFLLAYTGHVFPWKGVDGIAPGFSQLAKHCVVAIVGGYPDDIQRVKSVMGETTDRVRFVGHVPRSDVRVWLAAADAAILPTSAKFEIGRSFTSPLKMFEYLAAGLPIIASDVPSSREILDDRVAILHRPDDPGDFVRAVNALISRSSVERERMSAEAKLRAAPYTWTFRGERIGQFIHSRLYAS